eukprot:PhM_4_TR5202/c3_g1_i1/m.50864
MVREKFSLISSDLIHVFIYEQSVVWGKSKTSYIMSERDTLIEKHAQVNDQDSAFQEPKSAVEEDYEAPDMGSTFDHFGMIIVTMPVFMGYACLNCMQHNVKAKMGIADDTSADSKLFGFAVSFLYLGNLIFRLLHNVIFSCMRPRYRVMLSFFCIMLAMNLLAWCIFYLEIKHMWVVFVGYMAGGMGIGSFEANVMSVLTPYGHRAKSWAVLGIPIGYNLINVGVFVALSIYTSDGIKFGVYMFVTAWCVIGFLYYVFCVEDLPFESARDDIRKFAHDLTRFREWFPAVLPFAVALMADMFCVAMCSAVVLYIYDM